MHPIAHVFKLEKYLSETFKAGYSLLLTVQIEMFTSKFIIF